MKSTQRRVAPPTRAEACLPWPHPRGHGGSRARPVQDWARTRCRRLEAGGTENIAKLPAVLRHGDGPTSPRLALGSVGTANRI
jgi:hypothetical protein